MNPQVVGITPQPERFSAPAGHHRAGLSAWLRHLVVRTGHAWVENPLVLLRFAGQLLSAWRCLLFDLSPRQAGRTLARFTRQTVRTTLRGLFVVVGLSLAIGIGAGVVARSIGPGLRAEFARVVMVAVLRDATPLILTLLVAGRMGGSIAARLGGFRAEDPRPSERELTGLVLPHLVAGTVSGALFYAVGAYCVALGYVSLGRPERLLDADPGWFLRLVAVQAALWTGIGKAALFGGMVAYVAAAFGLEARRRAAQVGEWRQVEARQDAVWETSVVSVLLATLLTVVLWVTVEAPLR